MSKLTEERIKELAEQMPEGFLWYEGCRHETGIVLREAVDFARAIEAELQPVQEPIAYAVFTQEGNIRLWSRNFEDLLKAEKMIATPLYAAPPDQTAEIERLREEIKGWKLKCHNHFLCVSGQDKRIATLESALREAKDALTKYQTRESYDDLEYAGYAGDSALTTIGKALGEK